jgi:hypothetical protein
MAYLELANTLVSDRQRELQRVASSSHRRSRRLFWRRTEPQLLAPTPQPVLTAPPCAAAA